MSDLSADLIKALLEAKQAWERMTPAEREKMAQAQRESWARQDKD